MVSVGLVTSGILTRGAEYQVGARVLVLHIGVIGIASGEEFS